MNWRASLLPLSFFVLAIAGCSTPPNEVIELRDGVLRATTYTQGQYYCDQRRLTPRWLGNAPAQTGILFQCY